jgi:hypothetical protein
MSSNRRARTATRGAAFLALSTAGVLAGSTLSIHAADAAPKVQARGLEIKAEAAVYDVVQEGLSAADAQAVAKAAGITPDARGRDGSFAFVDAKGFAKVPSVNGARGKDEKGRATLVQKVNLKGLRAIKTLPDEKALGMARQLLPTPEGFDVHPRVGHTQVQIGGKKGNLTGTFNLDTTVSYDLMLGRAPVFGPGAKSRITFDGAGRVQQLVANQRSVKQSGFVGIIDAATAQQQCATLYGARVKQGTPTLVYYAPPLGSVKQLLPSYACHPSNISRDAVSALGGRLVPASPQLTPELSILVKRSGRSMRATASAEGGTAPYSIKWSSSSTLLGKTGTSVSYAVGGRAKNAIERLTATITDANGIVSTATAAIGAKGGSKQAFGYGGGGGAFGSVGIEQTVDEWQCAQDSAIGFKNVMNAHSQSVAFDWRGANAWEQDFHKTSTGGHDNQWVDSVDAQWYTGHGNSGGFTFKGNNPDTSIVPGDARWGDNFNLEWMQLESCQVLRDTNGFADYFGRWAPAFDGLHLLNGFDTNATCIGGGTGGRFASYLFPTFWRGALSVSQAWAAMANDLEPSGTKWRSISPLGPGFSHNLNDRYWGQGTTGADIPASSRIGFIAISSTV